MKKRAFERIPAHLEFDCFDKENYGTITNISENGMFIKSQHIRFPLESQFEILLEFKQDKLQIPVKVSRITKSNGYYDGIGVELLKSPGNYLKLIRTLRAMNDPDERLPS